MSEIRDLCPECRVREIKAAVVAALGEVNRGIHDAELEAAGHPRPSGTTLEGHVHLSQGQGLSPEDWRMIIADFGPLAEQQHIRQRVPLALRPPGVRNVR